MAAAAGECEGVAVDVETGDVSVIDKEVKEGFKRHTVYKVEIKINEKTITVFRRYSQFLTILEKLKKKFPNAALKLPGKKIFGNFDPEVIRTRRHAVKDFVAKVITNPEIMLNDAVRTFLGLDSRRTASRCDEADDEAYYSGQSRLSTRRNSTDGDQLMMTLQVDGCLAGVDQKHIKPNDFEFLSVVGKGSFGKVFLARRREDDELLAVKVLSKDLIMKSNEVHHIMCERRVLSLANKHPFLVGLHCSFQTKSKLYLVMDYVSGGEIFFHLQKDKRFSESRARFYAAEISSALGYLHDNDIIYRDLKPENILLDAQGHVMLTDFGLCKEGTTDATTFCGTPEYLSPELLQSRKYDRMVDWWCLGSVVYEMIFGLPPFYSRDRKEMFDRIQHKTLEFKNDCISASTRSFLTELLEKDKVQRLGYRNDFDEVKCHAFFSTIDWSLLLQRGIQPPFVPQLHEKTDVRNFDAVFTKEFIPDSIVRAGKDCFTCSKAAAVTRANTADRGIRQFDGFSYVRPSEQIFCF